MPTEQGLTEQRPTTRDQIGRRKRQPIGGARFLLSLHGFKKPENKMDRWVRDDPGRLDMFAQDGWQFLGVDKTTAIGDGSVSAQDPLSKYVRRAVGAHRDGRTMYQYYMLKDIDEWKADQDAKQAMIDETDSSIVNGGAPGAEKFLVDGQYIPKEGIKLQSKLMKQPGG